MKFKQATKKVDKNRKKVRIKEYDMDSSGRRSTLPISSTSAVALVLIVGFSFGFIIASYTGSSLTTVDMKSEPRPMEIELSNDDNLIQPEEGRSNTNSKGLDSNSIPLADKIPANSGNNVSNRTQSPEAKSTAHPTVEGLSRSQHPPPGSKESFKIENLRRKIPASEVGIAIRKDMKRYICNGYGPRLGNLMFLYATCYGTAYDFSMTLALNNGDYIYGPFEGIPKPKQPKSRYCRGGQRSFNEVKPRFYKRFNIQKTDKYVKLNGYLQSWKYFANSFDDLKQQFTWRKSIREAVVNIIQRLVKTSYPKDDFNSVTTVGIHIRRGDYVHEHRPMADKPYIESAKQYFLSRYPKVLFIVTTNPESEARTWCTTNVINGTGKTVFSGAKNDRYVDMALLSMTNHVIISTGTYGWWAGFLSNGTVIHYDWIPKNHYKFNREDYILPYWIGIKATKIDWSNSQFRTIKPL
ncbi:galactoside 2-alpha-L-fucosyltransferase 2-like [Mizuhopecten yessoensis]|uniref:L-Fucosyltransferase n=1 Tax=Mizuhopecten yessoensis TaxID=6573 RepID=A0A210QUF9_MIZYE|nr:galactoside 2-alpha-L-fucosyltransferase 2-like [Mizuhopecten yessoensis]OWF52374.1 Galactoside 2-alpha-L-fucosyltransferase 2 [Mizuhopecten yessoensis]